VQTVIARLARTLGRKQFYSVPGRAEILNHLVRRAPLPMVLWDVADPEMLARWAVHRDEFPGVDVVRSYRRRYRMPDTAVHLRGRTGVSNPVTPEGTFDFCSKDLVGLSGIERACDYRLRGVPGHETVTVDVFSFLHDVLDESPPQAGDSVCLSLDLAVQRRAEALLRLDSLSGAVVAMDVRTGEVLVLASEPSPGLDVGAGEYQALRRDAASAPFVNRALQAAYAPGSILKPLIALAALESGAVTPSDTVVCDGAYELGPDAAVRCWLHTGHGPLQLCDALGQSCNVYFCTIAERAGPDAVTEWAQRVGLGERPFSLLHEDEQDGILFSPQWKREHGRDSTRWLAGDTANMAIGQGAWSVTPLQACVYASCLATGRLVRPRFLRSDEPAEVVAECGWAPANLAVVREGMRRAVEMPGGTARRAGIPGVTVCAKTGTAQTVMRGFETTCGWTIAFAPADAPRFAVVCAVEDAASGGGVAGPIVREVLRLLLARSGSVEEEPPLAGPAVHGRRRGSADDGTRLAGTEEGG
jgi:penicillin-binding protein 2